LSHGLAKETAIRRLIRHGKDSGKRQIPGRHADQLRSPGALSITEPEVAASANSSYSTP